MAFTMKALPSSLCLTHKAFSVETHSRTSCRLPNGAYYARMRSSIIRCNSSQDEARSASSGQGDSTVPKDSGTNSAANSATMLLNAEEGSEPFAGWEPLTPEPQGNWKAALLQVGAGFVLALGFGLVGFTSYQKLERKFRPPAPVATQQQLVTTSDNGTSDIQEDEASKNEEGKKVTSADSEAQGKAQNDTNSRDKLEAETGMEKEKSLSQNKNEKLISENQVPLEELEMDEEGFLAGSFDDYQDGNPQQNKSSRSTLENFETAGSDFSDQKSNVSSIAPTSDTAGGFLSVGNFVASEDSKPVVQEGVGEPGISSESNNVNDSISGTAGVSRIVVPELADGSRVIEIVLLSPEGNKPSKGQTASDTADSEYDNEHRQNGLQFSTEGVNVSENASAPTVKGLEVDNHISSTAAPETENRSFKENQPDISEAVVENSPQQTEFRNYKFQDLEAEKASMMNSTEDHVDKEFDGETTETNTSEAAQGGASSTWMYSSLYVPAPLSPSGATQVHSGKVVVPAVVEQAQEHALKALQSLEVVDAQADPGAICTRREYARWLIGSSLKLARSPGHKIYPAMYIDNITELAYDDVAVEDPDFPYIQGLAEAGLIASNLSGGDNRGNRAVFHPDSYLSRQDLVTWKIALDRRELPGIDKETLQEVSGFIDADRVHKDARPALMADLVSEEHSIIASAFGFTRRFQPDKPTTIGQAAIALTSGEAADLVAEDMARIEAEAMATQAVVADIAKEVRALRENNGNFQDEVNVEKAKREQAEKLINELRVELEEVKAERDAERYSYLKGRATVDSEKGILQLLRQQVDQQAQELSALQAQVAGEKERFEKLRLEREAELEAVSHLRADLEVEKKALTLVRIWAEDEAKQARAQGKILEEARQRWEGQGFEIDSDIVEALNPDHKSAEIKDIKAKLDNLVQQVVPQQKDPTPKDNEFKTQVNDAIATSWQSMKPEEMRAKLEELVQRVVPRQEPTAADVELKAQVNNAITSWQTVKPEEMRAKLEELVQQVVPRQEPTAGDVEFKTQVNDAIINYWHATTGAASGVLHKLIEFLEELGRKLRHVQGDSMPSAGQRAQELKETASERLQGMQGKVGESTQGFQGMVGERAEGVKSAVAGMSTSFVEGSKQVSANIREEAQKLAQRFRN